MANPLPQALVIFGASGDLTRRKLIPALFHLHTKGLLPNPYAIVGVARTPYSPEEFRALQRESLRQHTPAQGLDGASLEAFLGMVHYVHFDTAHGPSYSVLTHKLAALNQALGLGENYVYYLATSPEAYGVIPRHLMAQGLNTPREGLGFKRLIVEKPFGTDLESAVALNGAISQCFAEDQLYRIDHYLGKETVQNLLVLRFANGIFEPLWNRNYIDHVEITAAESLGIEGRGGYYERAGALRDMLQNHLMQLVALTAMEPPSALEADPVRNEVVKVLQSLRPLTPHDIRHSLVRGQYVGSATPRGPVPGYRQERGVAPDSRTETFVAMRLWIDSWRWGGVPFYLRTGKHLPTKVTEISVHFRATPHRLFRGQCAGSSCNQLIIRIQPDEGIVLKFGLKMPGSGTQVEQVGMSFKYSELADATLPDAYERLLLDCMLGDATLYARADAVEASWRFFTPVLQAWAQDPSIPLHGYPAGTWGPKEADGLMHPDHLGWRNPCRNLSASDSFCEL